MLLELKALSLAHSSSELSHHDSTNFQTEQIENFLEAESETEMILPPSLTSDEVEAIRAICRQNGLNVVTVERPKRQTKVVKKV